MGLELSNNNGWTIDGKVQGLSSQTLERLKSLQASKGGKLSAADLKQAIQLDGKIDVAEQELLEELLSGKHDIQATQNTSEAGFSATSLSFIEPLPAEADQLRGILGKAQAAEREASLKELQDFIKALPEATKDAPEPGKIELKGEKLDNGPAGEPPKNRLDLPDSLLNDNNKHFVRGNDNRAYSTYIDAQKALHEDPAAEGLSEAQRKQRVLDKTIDEFMGPRFKALPPEQQQAVRQFLQSFEPGELISAEVQGAGGTQIKTKDVIGNAVDGHYVGSMLASIRALAETGRLTPAVLQSLQGLKNAELHSDLADQRSSLLRSTLHEIAFPDTINQHGKGTCAGTSVQILFALKDPARYVQMVQALASPTGKVPASLLPGAGAQGMAREAGTLKDDDSGRSIVSRLMQPAFMEYADGVTTTYNNAQGIGTHSDGSHGLYQSETVHLLEGLFGEGSYETERTYGFLGIGATDKAELMGRIEGLVAKGEPVPIGMRWADSAHEIVLTKIDRSQNRAYFMNPWGELQHMPIDELQERLQSAALPTRAPGSKPAMELLPGDASNPENYTAMPRQKYCTPREYLATEPVFKNKLSDDQRSDLESQLKRLDLNSGALGLLKEVAEHFGVSQSFFDRFQQIPDKDQAMRFLRLYSNMQSAKLPAEMVSTVMAAYPEKHLSTAAFEDLIDAVYNHQDKLPEMLAPARQAMLRQATGLEDVSKMSQEQILTRFRDLEGGWTSEASYQKLEYLASAADPATKAQMMRDLMKGATPERAERAMHLILAQAPVAEQKQILTALDLKRLGKETENADRAAETLQIILKAGFDPAAMEQHLNGFFDGVSSQTWFFNLINTDDDTAMSFVRQFDDETLKKLPDSVKQKFFQALDRGTTSEAEFQAMERLARNAGPAGQAAMIKYLIADNPDQRQEDVIFRTIINASMQPPAPGQPSPLLALMDKLDTRDLANALQNEQQAGAVAARLARASHDGGRVPVAGKASDFLRTLAWNHREDALNAFVRDPQVQTNGRAVYASLSTQTVRDMANYLMKGDTNEAEEDCIMNLLRASSWEQYGELMRDEGFRNQLGDELDSEDIVQLDKWTAEYSRRLAQKP